jgi:hypothetical protein
MNDVLPALIVANTKTSNMALAAGADLPDFRGFAGVTVERVISFCPYCPVPWAPNKCLSIGG